MTHPSDQNITMQPSIEDTTILGEGKSEIPEDIHAAAKKLAVRLGHFSDSAEVDVIREALELSRRQGIAEGFDAYWESLQDASKWCGYVGTLLGLIEWVPEWETLIVDNEEDRAAYDEINAAYLARAKETAASAREVKQIISEAKKRLEA